MSRVLLAVTGSVAAVRTPALTQALLEAGHDVRVIVSRHGLAFFDPSELMPLDETATLPKRLYRDEDEWPAEPYRPGTPILHIELRRWAEILLVAPLDALTLGRMALGLPENLIGCVYRAWDRSRPILLAPAMNTLMWQHPSTVRHLRLLLEDWGGAGEPTRAEAAVEAINLRTSRLRIVAPVEKQLACGDWGPGGMAPVDELVRRCGALLPSK